MPKPILLEVMKARAGIPTNDLFAMLWAKKLRAGSSSVQTLTGIPPLSFKSNGTPLISWSMKGNGSQSGTPTPDAPIMPTFCGVRTANLFDTVNFENAYPALFDISGSIVRINATAGIQALYSAGLEFAVQAPFSISFKGESTNNAATNGRFRLQFDDDSYEEIPITKSDGSSNQYVSATFDKNLKRIKFNWSSFNEGMAFKYLMLNSGSTALPYEPYGWKISFTCAGQTVPVYLGQTQTVRRIKKLVLTGKELWVKSGTYQGSFYAQIVTNHLSENYTAYCSHLTFSTLSQYAKGKFCFNGGAIKNCNLWLNQFDSSTTVEELKSYLAAQYAAGTPVVIWYVLAEPETTIVNEPLCKIGDYADELHSEDAGVTIPTAKGQNTLTVETELQPSEMTIRYKA